MTDVLIIAVNYGTAAITRKLALSLIAQKCTAWRCVLVDNGDNAAGRALLDRLPDLEDRIRIVRPQVNLGYFGGVRYGLDSWSGGGAKIPEWTIVTNADIRFGPTFIENLMAVDVETDIAAPSIVSGPAGGDQNPYLLHPLSQRQVMRNHFIFSHHISAQLGRIYAFAIKPHIRGAGKGGVGLERNIYAAHGSLMCFRRSWFDRGGNLDHDPFLYGEEITIAQRAVSIGARITYVPTLRAVHDGHKSTGLFLTRRMAAYQAEAARYVRYLLEHTESA